VGGRASRGGSPGRVAAQAHSPLSLARFDGLRGLRRWRYYRCSKGCRPHPKAAEIEEAVWTEITRYIRDPELLRKGADAYHEHGLVAWREEMGTKGLALAELDTRIARVWDGFDGGVYTKEQATQRATAYEEKKATLEAEIAVLADRIERGENHEARLRSTMEWAGRLGDPDTMTFEERRQVFDVFGITVVLPAGPEAKLVIRWYGAALVGTQPDQYVRSRKSLIPPAI
jgi:hypothetical protein